MRRIIWTGLFSIFWIAVSGFQVARASEKAAKLIDQAHQFDCQYSPTADASQKQAIALYEQALTREPDPNQTLHILHRMAQLYSSAYLAEKGEKPNHLEAIRINKRILETYPLEGPTALEAMSRLADSYLILNHHSEALEWSRRIVELDTQLAEQHKQKVLEEEEPTWKASDANREEQWHINRVNARRAVRRIHRYKVGAIDRIGYLGRRDDPWAAEIALGRLVQQNPEPYVLERIEQILPSIHARQGELLSLREMIPQDPVPKLTSVNDLPAATTKTQPELQPPAKVVTNRADKSPPAIKTGDNPIPQTVHPINTSRGPPLSSLLAWAGGISVLTLSLCYSMVIIRKHRQNA